MAKRKNSTGRTEIADRPQITIDADKNCVECGAKGTTPSGYCLKCIAQANNEEQDRRAGVNTDTGEVSKDPTLDQIKRLVLIRDVEHTIAKLECDIDDQKAELKSARTSLKKKQKYLRSLIVSNPAEELPFEE